MEDRELTEILRKKVESSTGSVMVVALIAYLIAMGFAIDALVNSDTLGRWGDVIAGFFSLFALGFGALWLHPKLDERMRRHFGSKICKEFGHDFHHSENPRHDGKVLCVRCWQLIEK